MEGSKLNAPPENACDSSAHVYATMLICFAVRRKPMADLAEVSTKVAELLAPLTPYLVEGGKKFAGKAGEAAWSKAQEVWNLLTAKPDVASKLRPAAELLSQHVDKDIYRTAFEEALLDILRDDLALGKRLVETMGDTKRQQNISASGHSTIEGVEQITSAPGTQAIRAKGRGTIKNIVQRM
jgi:hypothetical protein